MQTTARAIDLLLCGIGDPLAEIRAIGPAHAEFNAALILRAAAGVIAKVPSALPSIRRALRELDRRTAAPAELAHAGAAAAWAGGDPVGAAEAYAAIALAAPTDLLALRLAQSCYFFLGWHDRFAALCDAVVRDWSGGADGLRYALAMTAFAHAESGDTAYAERVGRHALTLDNTCPMAVHAVAHAYAESGRHHAGARWMRDQRAHWSTESRMRTHNAWHLAMFDLEGGDTQSAIDILDDWLLPAGRESVLDACDATALLWGLELAGVATGDRWRSVSDSFVRTEPGFWPYIDLHAGFAHTIAGYMGRAERLARAVARSAAGVTFAALRAREITVPGLAAFAAIGAGRRDEAVRLLARLKPLLAEAGGSRAQLDVFYRVEGAQPRSVAVRSVTPFAA